VILTSRRPHGRRQFWDGLERSNADCGHTGSNPIAGAPNLNLSPDEKRVYGQLFRQADTDNVGVVTGEIAVKFFEKTRLDSRILGEVSLMGSR